MFTVQPRLPLNARDASFSDLEPLELAISHLPKWLMSASPDIITALNDSMAQSRFYHGAVGRKFSELEGVESYCGALLANQVQRKFGPLLNIYRDYLSVVHVHLMGDVTLLASLRHYTVEDEPKALLWAALQNFSEDEALPGGFNPQSRILHNGNVHQASPVKPHEFAALCRTLDVGQKYQSYLENFLGVSASSASTPTAAQKQVHNNLEQLKVWDMQVDVHIAYLKKNISETAYRALLGYLKSASSTRSAEPVKLDDKVLILSSLSILDTVLEGIVVFSADTLLLHPGERLVVYIPNDPIAPFFEFSSLQVFIDELKIRLIAPAYVNFFSRFVALSVRPAFLSQINSRPAALGLTADVLHVSAAHYLYSVQIQNMFADARHLAVPTGVLDEQAREQRWQLYKGAGLLLINVAALFVPVLGDMMLAVAIGDMLKEVYEGVEDWSQGDVDHARAHLLAVAKDIAVNAAIVAGVTAVKGVASRLSAATNAHFESFEPIKRSDGSVRLWNKELQHYENEAAGVRKHMADRHGFFTFDGEQHVSVNARHYPVEFDRDAGLWRSVHRRRPQAFKPALLHNGEGAWQYAHEHPLEWAGSEQLVGRFGSPGVSLDGATLEQIRQLTHTCEALMRRAHLENRKAPPLLAISLKRFEIDRTLDVFIEQMKTSNYSAHRWSEWQLQQLPHMPGWPTGKGLVVVDETGHTLARYGSTQGSADTHINLTVGALAQGKLFEAVLAALSGAQGKALIGDRLGSTAMPAKALAEALVQYVQNNRTAVFERLYEAFNVSSQPEAKTIEAFFPGLPRPLAQALFDSASASQREVLRISKVPLRLAEMARFYLRESRLNRAIEGFYLRGQAHADTDKLVLHFMQQLPGWPADVGLDVRSGSLQGANIFHLGGVEAVPPRVLVKTRQAYQGFKPEGSVYVADTVMAEKLTQAIFEALSPLERERMGFNPQRDIKKFESAIAVLASENREKTAQVLGMQPIKPWFKPPTLMADGQLGYPLCGLDSGAHSARLQRRVRELFPSFNHDQVDDYLDGLVASGVDPLNVLRERKRIRKTLRDCLQLWVDATPTEMPAGSSVVDYPENRYQAAGMIERIWGLHPDHTRLAGIEVSNQLSLNGLRTLNFPALPLIADFSHIRELNLSNMKCKDTAGAFLDHFSGVESLQMDNNEMSRLPAQLENMPNLRRLSVAQNNLHLNSANQLTLSALSKLEILNLNDNFLGPEPDFTHLSHLRRVYLRRTGIDQWPSGLITRPLLEAADLRENHIAEIPDEVYHVSPKLTRNITLTNNPLSAASRLRLARFTMQGGSSLGINSDHLLSEAAAFEFWSTGITTHELARRELLWNSLRADPESDDFFNVISRLTTTAGVEKVRQDLSRRVWEMVEAANESAALRLDLMNIASAPRSCTDSVLMAFSNLEIQMELAKVAQAESAQPQQLYTLGKRLFRLEKLGAIAQEHCELIEDVGHVPPDELEVLLAYRVGLAKILDLPGQPQNMMFKNLAGVTTSDLEAARQLIVRAEKNAEHNVFISTLDFWKAYLIRTAKPEYNALTEPYFEALSELLKKSPEMSSQRYLFRVSDVRNRMDAAVDAWCLQKTNALLPLLAPGSPSTDL